MYKATQSSQQFFAREAMHSTKGSRRGFDLLDHGVNPTEVLTLEQQRASLVARWKALQKEHAKYPKNSEQRIEIGKQMQFVQNEISSIRPKMKLKGDAQSHFISAAKDMLSAPQYRAIMNEAARRAGEDRDKLRAMGFV